MLSISHDQILHGDLASLLEEEYYNVTTIVNSKLFATYLNNYLPICLLLTLHSISGLLKGSLMSKMSDSLITLFMQFIMHLSLTCYVKCLNAFLQVTFSSMFITSCYYVSFLSTYSKTLIIYIPFQWSSSKNERAKTICAGL